MLDAKRTRANRPNGRVDREEQHPLLNIKIDSKHLGRKSAPKEYDFSVSTGLDFDEKPSSWIKTLDYVSSFMSVVALILAVYYSRQYGYLHELWDETVILGPNTTQALVDYTHLIQNGTNATLDAKEIMAAGLIHGLEARSASVEGFCTKDGKVKHSVYTVRRAWNDTVYSGSAMVESAKWPDTFDPWIILMVIFIFSILFQFKRANSAMETYEENEDKYYPLKPDFWRWLEYALTSPFQILLISTSVIMGERSQLLALMGLQAGLVMLGFVNEKRIDKFYKRGIKIFGQQYYNENKTSKEICNEKEIQFRPRNKVYKLVILMTLSWLLFAIIWFIIVSRFHRQVSLNSDCMFEDKMPWAVWFIVVGQGVLFALFGVVQTWQVARMFGDSSVFRKLYNATESFEAGKLNSDDEFQVFYDEKKKKFMYFYSKEQKKEYDNKVPDNDLKSVHGLQQRKSFCARRRRDSWNAVAICYSVLSVLAKSLLEFGFIMLVVVEKDMVLSGT